MSVLTASERHQLGYPLGCVRTATARGGDRKREHRRAARATRSEIEIHGVRVTGVKPE